MAFKIKSPTRILILTWNSTPITLSWASKRKCECHIVVRSSSNICRNLYSSVVSFAQTPALFEVIASSDSPCQILFGPVSVQIETTVVVVVESVVVDVVGDIVVVDFFDDDAVVVVGAVVVCSVAVGLGIVVAVSKPNLSSRILFRAADLFFIAFNFISMRGLILVSLRWRFRWMNCCRSTTVQTIKITLLCIQRRFKFEWMTRIIIENKESDY